MADQLLSESELLAPIDDFDSFVPPVSADASGAGDDLFGDFGAAPAESISASPPAPAAAENFELFAAAPPSEPTNDAAENFDLFASPSALTAAAPAPAADDFDVFNAAPSTSAPVPATSSSPTKPTTPTGPAKTNLSLYTQAEPGFGLVDDSPLREWQRKHNESLAKKEAESQQKHKEILAQAETDLQKFFADRANSTAARARENRTNSVPVLDAAPPADRVWSNVASLCDLTETHRPSGGDVTRMRDVLISLKHN